MESEFILESVLSYIVKIIFKPLAKYMYKILNIISKNLFITCSNQFF